MKKIIYLIFVALIGTSCASSVKFTSDFDKEVDFTKYKSLSYLGWAKDSDKILNEFDKERIEGAFAMEFMKRGIEFKQTGGDMAASLFIVVDQKTGVTAYTDHYGGYGGGYYYGGWGWGGGYSTTRYNEYDYNVGTLILDVFDQESKKLIWQGVVSGEIDSDPKSRERNIPRIAMEIMKQYPVPQIKELKNLDK